MKHRNPTLFLLFALFAIVFPLLLVTSDRSVTSQIRERRASPQDESKSNNDKNAGKTPAVPATAEVVKVDVDLVTVDALVLQKNTARIVGGLKKEDFLIYEDGTKQEISHFSQDSLPLSVLFLIDRGGCLDPFGDKVHHATVEAVSRLKPTVEDALNRMPMHDEEADHCLNQLFFDAADYMVSASNPEGRRVIVVITGVTRNFDCLGGPSGKLAAQQVYESGSVVCGIIPKEMGQGLENGVMVWATRMGKLGGQPYLDIENLANETGGELLSDKPENLSTTFQTLMDHLRSRYNLAFVSTNKKRDGTTRKLKIDVQPPAAKPNGKLVVKARRSYVAPRS
jgi:Ca-activated chloride channel family protein